MATTSRISRGLKYIEKTGTTTQGGFLDMGTVLESNKYIPVFTYCTTNTETFVLPRGDRRFFKVLNYELNPVGNQEVTVRVYYM